jgi:hypothetical protein
MTTTGSSFYPETFDWLKNYPQQVIYSVAAGGGTTGTEITEDLANLQSLSMRDPIPPQRPRCFIFPEKQRAASSIWAWISSQEELDLSAQIFAFELFYFPLGQESKEVRSKPFRDAWQYLTNEPNETTKHARNFLLVLERLTTRYNLDSFLSIWPVFEEDGTTTLEWIMPNRRLGFSFESDFQDPYWFFANSRGSSGSGLISSPELYAAIRAFLLDENI